MKLFTKAEYVEVVLPFLIDNSSDDVDACVISIEAYVQIGDDCKYCYAAYEVNANQYDELLKLLITTEQKLVKVIVKVKNGIIKGFKLDLNDLAERFHDKRLEKIVLLGWGLSDKSSIKQKGRA